jgi:hypothetical protein
MLQVPIPDTGERLDAPHFGRAEVDLAVRADEHGLAKLQFSDLSVPTPEITWKSWRRKGNRVQGYDHLRKIGQRFLNLLTTLGRNIPPGVASSLIVAQLQFSDLIVPLPQISWKSWRRRGLARQRP